MKVNAIKIIIRGVFAVGVSIILLSVMLPVLFAYMATFMYIGGMIGALGMIFSVICLRYPSCPNCHQFVVFPQISTEDCPHCGERIEQYEKTVVK